MVWEDNMNLYNLRKINPILYYKLKTMYRRFYLKQFRKKNIVELQEYDAELYKSRVGKKLDWNHLNTYTEKMQWEKMFNSDPRKIICSDKYLVREWVKEKIGEEYLIPNIGVWDRASEIDFADLPQQFVLKTNCGSGDIILVRDKRKLSPRQIREYKAKLDYYLHFDFGCAQCELHYSHIQPKIIAEKLLEYDGGWDLPDYKFLCFDGEVKYCWVDLGRYHKHRRNVYDLNWNLQDWNQKDYGNYPKPIDKPDNFDEMVNIAKTLSVGFAHVRVDLYNLDGKIYFGEMTFTNGSGFERIYPDEADLMLGNLWKIGC